MKNLFKINLKLLLGFVLGATILIGAAQWSQQYSESLQAVTNQAGWLGVSSYIGVMALSIVIAPLGTGFLVPVAANSFGPFLAAIYSIIGWTIGSMIAFLLARYVKRAALYEARFIERVQEYEQKLPRWYFYGMIVGLRMTLPVDVLSYALGVASSISLRMFFVTTVLGITPFTFIFTYSSESTIWVQVLVALISILVFLGGVFFVKQKILK